MMVHVYNPGPGKMEIGRPWGALPGQPSLLGHFHASDRPHLIKKKRESNVWRMAAKVVLGCACMHMCAHISFCKLLHEIRW